MKVLVDMNLSPDWVGFISGSEIQTIHWSAIGPGEATDNAIFNYAAENGW
jgi:predicted nuclease of predicted toxin-antitoxin system